MKKFFKFWAVAATLIVGVILLAINNFYGYDQFTADPNNDGATQRGALKKYANANVPFVLDSNPVNMGSRTAMEVITSAFTTWTDVV
ncbi:MAG: hypothetical protein ONA90_10080, partial [candidate division KSB1 bacterium]|nr:hypothetical protein [candidate division KSB1 bacterium]